MLTDRYYKAYQQLTDKRVRWKKGILFLSNKQIYDFYLLSRVVCYVIEFILSVI